MFSLFTRKHTNPPAKRPRALPTLEALEDRTLPAVTALPVEGIGNGQGEEKGPPIVRIEPEQAFADLTGAVNNLNLVGAEAKVLKRAVVRAHDDYMVAVQRGEFGGIKDSFDDVHALERMVYHLHKAGRIAADGEKMVFDEASIAKRSMVAHVKAPGLSDKVRLLMGDIIAKVDSQEVELLTQEAPKVRRLNALEGEMIEMGELIQVGKKKAGAGEIAEISERDTRLLKAGLLTPDQVDYVFLALGEIKAAMAGTVTPPPDKQP